MKARFVNTLRFCSNPLPPLRSWRCRRSFTSFNRHRRRNNSYGGWNVRQCRSGCQHLELALYRSLVRSIPRRECLDLLPSLRRYVFSVFTGSSERIDPSSSDQVSSIPLSLSECILSELSSLYVQSCSLSVNSLRVSRVQLSSMVFFLVSSNLRILRNIAHTLRLV